MKKIIIIGNGIGANTLYGYLKRDKMYKVVAFCVDKEYIDAKEIFDLPVISFEELKDKYNYNEYSVVLGVGYKNQNKNRELLYNKVKDLGFTIETYIHPTAVILNDMNIGEGSMIFAGTVIEPFTIIGKNTLIWSNCTIAHNAVIEDNCWIAANSIISGHAKVKNNSFVGINCTISNNVEIAMNNIIGAGSLVTKSTKENEVYLSRTSEKHRFDAEDYSKYYLK